MQKLFRRPLVPLLPLLTGVLGLSVATERTLTGSALVWMLAVQYGALTLCALLQLRQPDTAETAWARKALKAAALITAMSTAAWVFFYFVHMPVFPVGYALSVLLAAGHLALGIRYVQGCSSAACASPATSAATGPDS